MMHRPGVFRSVVLLIVVCAAAFGCQMKKEAPAEQAQAAAVPAESAPQESAPAAQAAAPVSASAPVNAVAGAVIASSEGDLPNMRVEINELKRDAGGTLTMKMTLVNTGTEKGNVGYNFGDPKRTPDYGSVGGVHLLDNANKEKFDVMRDAEDNCVCSRSIKDLEPGAQAKVWAKFTAPPDDVNALTVVVPHFIPMENVPISR